MQGDGFQERASNTAAKAPSLPEFRHNGGGRAPKPARKQLRNLFSGAPRLTSSSVSAGCCRPPGLGWQISLESVRLPFPPADEPGTN